MQEQEPKGAADTPETILPSAGSPTTDVSDEIGSTSRNSMESEEKRPALGQRLAEAFREGVASAKPDYEKRPEERVQPLAEKPRQEPSDAGILDRVVQEGGSAVAAAGGKAASALGSLVQLTKRAPAIAHKYADAFREGAASVKPREGRERSEELPPSARKNWSRPDGKVMLDRVFRAGSSAAGLIRGAVAAVKPSEVRGAGQKIRICKKKINSLYVEIGREAVDSWGNAPVETEKVSELLNELRKNEEEIRSLQEHIAELAAARKAKAATSQPAEKEAVATPAPDKDIRFDMGVSGDKPAGEVYHLGDWQQPESPDGGAVAVAEMPVSAAPEAESPASPPAPEQTVDAETAPQEEASDGADQALPMEPEPSQEKTEDTDLPKRKSNRKRQR